MPPKNSRKAVADAALVNPAGGSDPASKSTPSKRSDVDINLPTEAEVTAGSSGLSVEEKLKALATVAADDSFIKDDSDEELEIDASTGISPHLRSTVILLFLVIPSHEVASVILTVRMLMKRVWANLLSDDVLATVKFQELLPAFVAKTRYSRLQVSFLRESDAVNIKQTSVDHKRPNGITIHCFWLHQEDPVYLRMKATNPQMLEVYFKGVPADIPSELVLEVMVKHPLKIRKQSAFSGGHCFHRVLHLMTGADTDKIKGLVAFIRRVLGPVVDTVSLGSHLLIMGDFNLVEDPLLDRTSRTGSTKENEELYRRCGAFHLSDAFRVLHPYRREFTFYSCANQSSSRIDRALISQSLLAHVEFVSHIMPADPISDHSFAVKAAFRLNTRVQLGPGLWRLPAYMLDRPGVRKVIEAVERQVDLCGDGFELLISRLNTALRAYTKEERKRVRATTVHLQRPVAELKQAWLGDPGCARLKTLLGEREAQLKSYQLVRQERLHVMAGLKEEVMGEVASPHLSAKIKDRKGWTQITELNAGGKLVNDNEAILKAASQYYKELFESDRQQAVSAWSPAPGRSLSQKSAEAVCAAWSEEEVKAAFRLMAKDKAPEKDGLPKELFEFHWDILGKHFMKLVDNFAATATLPTSTKDDVTILLHKKGGREQLENCQNVIL
ncbi:unnamed protein product [Closterium sp. NIES-65]|nr:unnamed protein product [Closterium sp. NIES-65]